MDVSAFRAALAAVGATVLTAACAAGQHAQTAEEKPSLDGTQGSVGSMLLNGVALHAPSGTNYSAGDDVALTVYITNNGSASDSLTDVSSPAFSSGWAVVPTKQLSSGAPAGGSSPSPQTIAAGSAVGYGLENLTPGAGSTSKNAIVLLHLAKPPKLYPGMSVPITFTFAKAGKATLTVPVELTDKPGMQSVPAPSGGSE